MKQRRTDVASANGRIRELYVRETSHLMDGRDPLICGIRFLEGLLKNLENRPPDSHASAINSFLHLVPQVPFLQSNSVTQTGCMQYLEWYIYYLRQVRAKHLLQVVSFLIDRNIRNVLFLTSKDVQEWVNTALERLYAFPVRNLSSDSASIDSAIEYLSSQDSVILVSALHVSGPWAYITYDAQVLYLSNTLRAREVSVPIVLLASSPQISSQTWIGTQTVGKPITVRAFDYLLSESGYNAVPNCPL